MDPSCWFIAQTEVTGHITLMQLATDNWIGLQLIYASPLVELGGTYRFFSWKALS